METVCAFVIALILSGIGILQLLVCLGRPYGRFVWGGQYDVLPRKLRIGSAISLVLYAFFVLVAFEQAHVTSLDWFSNTAENFIWPITVYMGIGIVVNTLSRSKSERHLMTPLLTVLFLCYLYIALNT